MSENLIPISEQLAGILTPSKYATDEAFADIATASSFLPRIQLMDSNSKLVKLGMIQMGHYALITRKDQGIDLSKEVRVWCFAWRPKAIHFDGDEIISVFDHTSPEFKDIALKSAETDSNRMFGPEFLLYVPDQKRFCTFHMSSKTARSEAPQLKALIGKTATLKGQLITQKKYSWWGPVITACSTPLEVPTLESIQEQVNRFNNPPASETEKAPEDDRPR